MSRGKNSHGLMIANNLEDLAEVIGGFLGMADGIEKKEYMDIIMTRAFRTADRKFNVAAAAAAKGKNFTHMYEYDTKGINPGNNSLIPTHQAARLWRTEAVGGGSRKLITYAFRPAVRPVPPKSTGDPDVGDIDQEVLDKLKVNNGEKYVFRNRAEATETGQQIWIKSRGGEEGLIFIPTVQDLYNPKSYEENRGFGIRKKHLNDPGEWSGGLGAFGGFFLSWWTTAGGASMTSSMSDYVNRDVRAFAKELGMKRGSLKPAQQVMIEKKVMEEFTKTTKQWQFKAQTIGLQGYEGEDGKIA